uniref:Uncharacterized protein n=1 Tax=Kwoniella bestiolae CBS 10118 TaxID=1296100 RepID=A0A1B9FR80_9TREE|nr:hypothetical protein I302_08950 [Kwoniella bestiolae CBS 10118]OCF21278.1 hypothetical protein I302_08950 [Kwoniella bestiolae CBS 10118]
MSLHRYFVPPPLALAVHPAPPPKPKPTEKEKAEKDKAEKEAKDKKDDQQDRDKKKADDADDKKDEKEKKQEKDEPATPATPGSMVPEPPTPAPGAADDKPETPEEDKANVDHEKPTGVKKDPTEAKEGQPEPRSTNLKDLTPEPEEQEPEKPLEPIRLLPPAPFRPIRTKLDLNPLKPYPPIPTDPRGAYHAYAKAVGNEVIYVDVTKDGWLTEQWKERSEREALKRLTGEWERELQRELEKQRENEKIREVPGTAQGILLELWNVLVEADNHEIAVDEFWAKFDWTKESAKLHLSNENQPQAITDDKEKKKDLPNGDSTSAEKKNEKEEEVEWTKEGLEEILSTVGVQCVYNVEKPSRHWAHPAGGYLLLSHGYFLLRTDMHINFKPAEKAGQFEVLVTSGHDRVFGEMVKAQREREYRERKEREKKERLAKEKDKGKEGKKEDEKDKAKKGEEGEEKNDDEDPSPGTPTSNVKLIDGEAIVPAAGDAVAILDKKDDKAIIAIPVDAKDQANGEDKDKDKKHEQEPAIVPGPKPTPVAGDEAKGEKGEEDKKPMNMDDIAKAFKALESSISKSVDLKDKEKEKDKVKLVWTWSERCETWRWKNFEMGLHNVGPGGWEERDWKVFADGREVWDFDDDEKVVEVEEEDIHDWSL